MQWLYARGCSRVSSRICSSCIFAGAASSLRTKGCGRRRSGGGPTLEKRCFSEKYKFREISVFLYLVRVYLTQEVLKVFGDMALDLPEPPYVYSVRKEKKLLRKSFQSIWHAIAIKRIWNSLRSKLFFFFWGGGCKARTFMFNSKRAYSFSSIKSPCCLSRRVYPRLRRRPPTPRHWPRAGRGPRRRPRRRPVAGAKRQSKASFFSPLYISIFLKNTRAREVLDPGQWGCGGGKKVYFVALISTKTGSLEGERRTIHI